MQHVVNGASKTSGLTEGREAEGQRARTDPTARRPPAPLQKQTITGC